MRCKDGDACFMFTILCCSFHVFFINLCSILKTVRWRLFFYLSTLKREMCAQFIFTLPVYTFCCSLFFIVVFCPSGFFLSVSCSSGVIFIVVYYIIYYYMLLNTVCFQMTLKWCYESCVKTCHQARLLWRQLCAVRKGGAGHLKLSAVSLSLCCKGVVCLPL